MFLKCLSQNGLFIFVALFLLCQFFLTYWLVRKYVKDRLAVMYRLMRNVKGKDAVKRSETDIASAEEDVERWAQSRATELNTLEQQEAYQQEFLGNIAHELKTPIRVSLDSFL